MNYIKHLTAYFDRVVDDHSLNPTHISLYIALFQFWNLNRFQNPISITRDEVMRISKICSKATYHKCMRELHEKGYVIYEPSYNPFKGSMLQMVNLSHELKPLKRSDKTNPKNKQVIEQEVNKQQTSSGTATEQALVSSINNINSTNNTNILNLDKSKNDLKKDEFKIQSADNSCYPELVEGPKKKLREKKGEATENAIPPQWQNVVQFFSECNVSEIEAQKYYNHFQSNGWLVSGKSKMKNWKAAARNWMLNSQKFNKRNTPPQPNHLHTSNHKNYGEPL
ncbi:hypothetical protein IP98_00227 [Flavobacterium cauense R2A-7]|uniref:Uncharacterized protein n=2 Tax=Flavobacterium TaxID=237 RepID=A0A562M5N8_9FLAO|nr:transcriptional regulator [Flavobacterium cauense R2A-7]TWI15236.1 hypothetical protein IP98_00227 [Flavobacterium cauense R2A-7]